jgi:6-phosphofructokinase 1
VDAVAAFAKARERDNGCTLVCIAEGARAEGQGLVVRETIASSPDPLRLGGVGGWLQQQLQPRLDSEVRSTLLGHTQRGGTPTAYDRVLATRFGWAAAELVREGRFGRMVVLRGEEIDSVEIAGIAGRSRPVPPDHPLLRAARDTGVMLGH